METTKDNEIINCAEETEEMVKFNVRGTKYEIPAEFIFNSKYKSKLTKLVLENPSKEVYINRCTGFFDLILDFHETGVVHLPENLCLPKIQEEMEFWNISEDCLAQCCWNSYYHKLEQERIVSIVCAETVKTPLDDMKEDQISNEANVRVPTTLCRVWRAMEDPRSSRKAMVR